MNLFGYIPHRLRRNAGVERGLPRCFSRESLSGPRPALRCNTSELAAGRLMICRPSIPGRWWPVLVAAALLLMMFSGRAQAQVEAKCTNHAIGFIWYLWGNYTGQELKVRGVVVGGSILKCQNQGTTPRMLRICLNMDEGSGGSLPDGTRLLQPPLSPDIPPSLPPVRYQIYTDTTMTQVLGMGEQNSAVLDIPIPPALPRPNAPYPFQVWPYIYLRLFAGQTPYFKPYYTSYLTTSGRYGEYAPSDPPPACGTLPHVMSPTLSRIEMYPRPVCQITSPPAPLNFGFHNTLSSNIQATSNLSVHCTWGLSYQIELGDGLHAQGGQRRMRLVNSSQDHWIEYELYQDPGLQQRWGSTPDERVSTKGDQGVATTHTIYARVPAQPTTLPGEYQDTVVVVVRY